MKIKYNQAFIKQNSTEKVIESISFPSASVFPLYSFDISSIEGINSFFILILYRDENQISYLNNIIIYLGDNN